MDPRRELLAFAAVLAALVAGFFAESLFGGKVLSSADVLKVSASFRDGAETSYEPANRLLMDPVLQFQPWLEFNRAMIRRGRLPLWNEHAGCGTPHLANGQSAVFDPFHAIAYLGSLPDAYAWIAAARLWVAGLGMFLLARCWGFGPWGRWFCGLAFPFCGFLVVWLLFPVTSVAVWMPWLFLASERVLQGPSPRTIGALGIATALVLFGGHVQTSAHVLLAAALYVTWRLALVVRIRPGASTLGRPPLAWTMGIALGVVVAAIEVVPLGAYLARSSVWGDRAREAPSPLALARPRLLGSVCTALPYAFGSQRRGHPHLGRALGVHNLNESAGGFAGLATLVCLAPLGWSMRGRVPRAWFLAGLAAFGAMGAFGLPPVDNLLRVLPVIGVTDNRRLTLWLAFGLVLLGGIGLDSIASTARTPTRRAVWVWTAAGLLLLLGAAAVGVLEPAFSRRSIAHYTAAAARVPGANLEAYLGRARLQVQSALAFLPRYYVLAAAQLFVLAALAAFSNRGRVRPDVLCAGLIGLTMVDLVGFGFGLNPAIARADDRPPSPVVEYLRRELPPSSRALGLGEELAPNTLMRYGLSDPRNYDSVELARSLAWFAPLYEPGARALSSRREVGWQGVIRARDRLVDSAVCAVVGASPPPPGAFAQVDRVGAAWVARLEGAPWAGFATRAGGFNARREPSRIMMSYHLEKPDSIVIRETFDSGWHAELDGAPVAVDVYRGVFLAVKVPAGRHELVLQYDPAEVRIAVWTSVLGCCAVVFALTLPAPIRSTRIVIDGLGRTQAAELESVLCSSPAKH